MKGSFRWYLLIVLTRDRLENGRVARLVAERVEWRDGRIVAAQGDELVWPADLVLVATGYTGPEKHPLYAQLGVELDAYGRIAADENGRTSAPDVFAAGDARRGASLIVWAIAEGRRAAASASAYLAGRRGLRVAATVPPVSMPPASTMRG